MPFKRGHLRYFVMVAEEGQVTRAAERLHIAQPALSQAIAHLECDLGFQLLERHPRGVTLTPAGEVFLEKARVALRATEDAVLTAESLARTEQGTIAFGYLGLPPASSDPDLIEAFTEAHPDIQLVPQELPFPSLPTASWLREVDAAICADQRRIRTSPSSALRAEPSSCWHRRVIPSHRDESSPLRSCSMRPSSAFISRSTQRGRAFGASTAIATGRPHMSSAKRPTHSRGSRCSPRDFGIAITPAYIAAIAKVLPSVVAIPLTDADPVIITLLARDDRRGRLVEALFATARQLVAQVSDGPLPADA